MAASARYAPGAARAGRRGRAYPGRRRLPRPVRLPARAGDRAIRESADQPVRDRAPCVRDHAPARRPGVLRHARVLQQNRPAPALPAGLTHRRQRPAPAAGTDSRRPARRAHRRPGAVARAGRGDARGGAASRRRASRRPRATRDAAATGRSRRDPAGHPGRAAGPARRAAPDGARTGCAQRATRVSSPGHQIHPSSAGPRSWGGSNLDRSSPATKPSSTRSAINGSPSDC